MRTHFIYSWDELDSHEEVSFDTFWNSRGDLVGLGVQFGTSNLAAKSSVRSEARSWIKGLVIHVRVGMPLLIVRLGELLVDLGNDHSASLCARPLFPLAGRGLVGLVGQHIGGVIASIGVLECDRPGSDHPPLSTVIPLKERLLWSSSALNLPIHEAASSSHTAGHIWSNPSIHIHELVSPSGNPMAAIAPHEAFHWAAGKEGLRRLDRISARVSRDPDSGETFLRGLAVSDTAPSTLSTRCIEAVRIQYQADELLASADEWTMEVDVDGPGGEIIEGVSVRCVEGWVKAILFRMNHDRKGILGEGLDIYDWSSVRVPTGHFIAGLAASFSVATDTHDPKDVFTPATDKAGGSLSGL
ncbi:hypothetical protein BJY01DRAFT_248497 [Aspergillus pseudoustus]|uniref:Uncharacterized protein n=1 Tax=Aspergillus pseudoustus TaxID=1810923 RepID=A0ABR4JUN7_9EURO